MSPKTRLAVLGTLLALGAVLSGCASGGASPTPQDLEGSWVLTSAADADGSIELGEAEVTLDLASGPGGNALAVSGSAACNSYNGAMTVDGDSVTLGPLSTTLMACEEELMEVESSYLAALEGVTAAEVDDDTLTLSGDDSELVYSRASDDE